ncbi:MAG: hypothetical protein ABFD98_03500 [Syntrophobacteraceae bacterium]|nr:hypothetical protein [Desulfobacteraceae bacterium]
MNIRQRIAVAAVDVAVLIEMCLSVYLANGAHEDLTQLFCKLFFSMLVPTLIVAWIAVRRLRSEDPELAA